MRELQLGPEIFDTLHTALDRPALVKEKFDDLKRCELYRVRERCHIQHASFVGICTVCEEPLCEFFIGDGNAGSAVSMILLVSPIVTTYHKIEGLSLSSGSLMFHRWFNKI